MASLIDLKAALSKDPLINFHLFLGWGLNGANIDSFCLLDNFPSRLCSKVAGSLWEEKGDYEPITIVYESLPRNQLGHREVTITKIVLLH